MLTAGIEFQGSGTTQTSIAPSQTNTAPPSQNITAPSQTVADDSVEVTLGGGVVNETTKEAGSNVEWGYAEYVRLVLRCSRMYGGFDGTNDVVGTNYYYHQQQQQHQQHHQQLLQAFLATLLRRQLFQPAVTFFSQHCHCSNHNIHNHHHGNNSNSYSSSSNGGSSSSGSISSSNHRNSNGVGSLEMFEWLYLSLVNQHRSFI